jgi:hypothetical protein
MPPLQVSLEVLRRDSNRIAHTSINRHERGGQFALVYLPCLVLVAAPIMIAEIQPLSAGMRVKGTLREWLSRGSRRRAVLW